MRYLSTRWRARAWEAVPGWPTGGVRAHSTQAAAPTALRRKASASPTSPASTAAEHNRLYYFRNYGDANCRGYIDLANGASVDVADDEDTPFAFRVGTPGGKHGEVWLLQAASESERSDWMREIRALALNPTPKTDLALEGGRAPGEPGGCAVS